MYIINTALEESRQDRQGPPHPASSEYTTYSESQVKVYKDDQLLSSTDNGVRQGYSKYSLTYLLTFTYFYLLISADMTE